MTTTETTNPITELTQGIQRAKDHIETIQQESKRKIEELKKRITILETAKALELHDIDSRRCDVARKIIEVKGIVNNDKRRAVVNDAIKAITPGGQALSKHYFGTKDYGGWTDQRSDHTYGMGPKHGTTVFSIGINKTYRDHIKADGQLEPEAIEICLWYLHNIERIQAAIQTVNDK